MAVTSSKVISLAKEELGYEEKRTNSQLYSKHTNAGKNNYTKYEKDVFGSNGNYWCATFLMWLFYMAAGKSKEVVKATIYALTMGAETLRAAFAKAGRYDSNPKVGDIIFFKGTRHAGANHVGLVIAVSSSTVTTIEGNTSDKQFDDNGGCVAQKTYSRGYSKIMGYGHPRYDVASNSSAGASTSTSSTVLKVGSKGEAVKTLQSNLNKVLGTKLTVDGDFGSGTKDAVIKFQKKYGLSADGIYGSASAAKMKTVLASSSSSSSSGTTVLKVGSKGENVKALQRDLNSTIGAGLTVDGDFGSGTKKALIKFQQKYGLSADGIYGPSSAAKMKSVLANKASVKIATATLRVGSKGENVKTLQRNLNSAIGAGLGVDGDFGSGTKKALIKFQQKYGLGADGIYGPASAAKMKSVLS